MTSNSQNVVVNGEDQTLPLNCTVDQMLKQLQISSRGLAIEINQQLISRSQFETVRVAEGDQIEIVTFVGGG